MNALAPSPIEIRDQLDRLRDSAVFARSASLFNFLAFVIEEFLAERACRLKELVIGDALYSGHSPYDPRIDSTVRVEARRLRRKLTDYYAGPGSCDPVGIALPTGGYHPVITRRTTGQIVAEHPSSGAERTGVDLAVMPFRALSQDSSDDRFADGLTDEVIFAFGEMTGLRLASRLAVFQYKNRLFSLADAAREMQVGAVLHGTVKTDGLRSRITLELTDSMGAVRWCERLDSSATKGIQAQEELAQLIVQRFCGECAQETPRLPEQVLTRVDPLGLLHTRQIRSRAAPTLTAAMGDRVGH